MEKFHKIFGGTGTKEKKGKKRKRHATTTEEKGEFARTTVSSQLYRGNNLSASVALGARRCKAATGSQRKSHTHTRR